MVPFKVAQKNQKWNLIICNFKLYASFFYRRSASRHLSLLQRRSTKQLVSVLFGSGSWPRSSSSPDIERRGECWLHECGGGSFRRHFTVWADTHFKRTSVFSLNWFGTSPKFLQDFLRKRPKICIWPRWYPKFGKGHKGKPKVYRMWSSQHVSSTAVPSVHSPSANPSVKRIWANWSNSFGFHP